MTREEAVKRIKEIQKLYVFTPTINEALDLAIEALKEPTGDYEFFGGTYAKEGDAESATTTDCISRQAAIEAFCDDCRGLKPGQCEHWDSCKSQKELRSLPPVTPTEPTDCTDFINWLLEEVLDEENWELNAVANGEIICRKLKKLDLLEVKDGYYVRASVTPEGRTGEWVDTEFIKLKGGAKMGGDDE